MRVLAIGIIVLFLLLANCVTPKTQSSVPAFNDSTAFQVFYAESAFRVSGDTLKSLQILTDADRINLKNGFIIISDFAGNLTEFSGDTVIEVEMLDRSMASIPYIQERANLGSVLQGTNRYSSKTGATMHAIPELVFLYPYLGENSNTSSVKMPKDQSSCLWWKPHSFTESEQPQYEIAVVNIFDEEIAKLMVVERNMIELDLMKLHESTVDSIETYGTYIGLSFLEVNQHRPGRIFIELTDMEKTINPCNAQRSVEYLQVAMNLEHNELHEEAREFYRKAAQSSERSIYKEILEYFEKRNSLINE